MAPTIVHGLLRQCNRQMGVGFIEYITATDIRHAQDSWVSGTVDFDRWIEWSGQQLDGMPLGRARKPVMALF